MPLKTYLCPSKRVDQAKVYLFVGRAPVVFPKIFIIVLELQFYLLYEKVPYKRKMHPMFLLIFVLSDHCRSKNISLRSQSYIHSLCARRVW